MIWVCPLSKVEATVASTRADRLLSLLAPGTAMTRPTAIAEQNHLWLSLHDIAEPQEGMTLPGEQHMRTLLDFAQSWDRAKPLVVNCYAGISRSTASAYIIAAALQPSRDEQELARDAAPGVAERDAQSAPDCARRRHARPATGAWSTRSGRSVAGRMRSRACRSSSTSGRDSLLLQPVGELRLPDILQQAR